MGDRAGTGAARTCENAPLCGELRGHKGQCRPTTGTVKVSAARYGPCVVLSVEGSSRGTAFGVSLEKLNELAEGEWVVLYG